MATSHVGDRDNSSLRLEISTAAAHQHGHVTRRQLLALGMTDTMLHHWCRGGKLVRVHAGVYAVGYRRVEPVAVTMAAVLACGPGALASHDSAAALWGWRRWPRVPEVVALKERRRPGIRSHVSGSLLPFERTRELGVPVTTPLRTITDLKPRVTVTQLTRLVNDARRQQRLTDDDVVTLLGYAGGPTRSEFEAAFLRFCRRYGLPTPQTLVTVAGYEVDALFARQRVVVELDGWAFHNDRTAFATDRERDVVLLDAGYLTVRITWDRLQDGPAREARRLQRILDAR